MSSLAPLSASTAILQMAMTHAASNRPPQKSFDDKSKWAAIIFRSYLEKDIGSEYKKLAEKLYNKTQVGLLSKPKFPFYHFMDILMKRDKNEFIQTNQVIQWINDLFSVSLPGSWLKECRRIHLEKDFRGNARTWQVPQLVELFEDLSIDEGRSSMQQTTSMASMSSIYPTAPDGRADLIEHIVTSIEKMRLHMDDYFRTRTNSFRSHHCTRFTESISAVISHIESRDNALVIAGGHFLLQKYNQIPSQFLPDEVNLLMMTVRSSLEHYSNLHFN